MKLVRWLLVSLLTAAAVMMIMSPSLLVGVLPQAWLDAASLKDFPLLKNCTALAGQLIGAVRGQVAPGLAMVTESLEADFLQGLLSLLMVSVLTIPVSLILGFLLYKPLYSGPLVRGALYCSLNLVSVMLAWVVYRQIYFPVVVQGLIEQNITDQTMQGVVSFLTQFLSAAAIGAVTIKIALAVVAAKVVLGKVVLPLIGTLVRTFLFALIVALLMLLQADITAWTIILPLILGVLIVSGLSDCAFGC